MRSPPDLDGQVQSAYGVGMFWMLVVACAAPETESGRADDRRPPVDTSVEVPPDADAPPVSEEDAGAQDADLDSWFFVPDTVHHIDLTLPAVSSNLLAADPYTHVLADVSIDGVPLPEVGVRLRGKIGSFRTLAGKPKFEVDFNHFVSDQRFYGLESLSLNNSVVDCSFLKEPMALAVLARAGVPASRTGFAWVTVNGADYGLYVIVETQDDRFTTRNWADGTGNLYDGKYVWYGGYNYVLLDFNNGVDELYALEEGTDVAWADIKGVSQALSVAPTSGAYVETLGAVLNWDAFHREVVGEQWTGQNDGYALDINNYRVYFDPADGKANIIPWDYDYSFLNDSDWGMSWRYPAGDLASTCFADPTCAATHAEMVATVLEELDPVSLTELFNVMDETTWDASQQDPRQECGASNVSYYRDAIRTWTLGRGDYMRRFWGL